MLTIIEKCKAVVNSKVESMKNERCMNQGQTQQIVGIDCFFFIVTLIKFMVIYKFNGIQLRC